MTERKKKEGTILTKYAKDIITRFDEAAQRWGRESDPDTIYKTREDYNKTKAELERYIVDLQVKLRKARGGHMPRSQVKKTGR